MASNMPPALAAEEVIVDCVAFFYEDQQEFDESSDEEVDVNTDDNHSQSQQDELGTSTLVQGRDMEGR